ncbi:MAG TPA: thioether cross-link-forming SCIFF peptide maturase, partial [Bacillota bacterium]|nr:thioether cross-link-forming SCIFF peptide maturase [Bacillota bacterium]
LAELRQQGYLIDIAEIEPKYYREPSLKALCLHVSHDCNLRCKYCFAGTGPFGGKREQMSFEVGKAAIDLLLANSGKRRQLEVDFFGGEPLMNFEVVKQLVEYGGAAADQLDKEIHFTLTTNGVALTEAVRQYLNDHQIAVVLSLDGRPEVNDRMRGKGCYDQIVPHYLDLIEQRNNQNYYLRGTFTARNLDFTEDARYLYDLGLRELSLEPVVSPDGDYRLTEAELPRIKAEYERLARFYLERHQAGDPFTFFHFEISLEHGPCLPKRLTGCGAGFDYFAVTPTGELYPCHQFVGRTEYVMGDVFQGINRPDLRQEFGAATLFKKEGCADCWSRYYCSGGCHANAQLINGSIYKPDHLGCELQRKRLECALALKGIALEEREKETK